jgi:hypothetical protein
MRNQQLRTGRLARAAIVGAGLAGALGTATALVIPTLHLGSNEDAWSPATGNGQHSGRTAATKHRATKGNARLGDSERDDDGWTPVTSPRPAKRQNQSARQNQPSGQTQPAPQPQPAPAAPAAQSSGS